MSQPSPDAKAVVRAAEALTTQVRRIADALSTPVVRYEAAADDTPTADDRQERGGHASGHTTINDLPSPPASFMRTDDGPTTADDDALRRMLTDALTAEHYRRAREQIVASPEEHSAGMADVVMRIIGICRAAEATDTADEEDAVAPTCWHTEPGSPCDWDRCRQPERLAAGDPGVDPATTPPLGPKLRAADEEGAPNMLRVLADRSARGVLSPGEGDALRRRVEQLIAGRETWKAKAEEMERDRDQHAAVLREVLDTFSTAYDRPDAPPIGHLVESPVHPEQFERWRSVVAPTVERPWWVDVAEIRAELTAAQAAIERVRKSMDDRPPCFDGKTGQPASSYEAGWRDHDRMVRYALDGTEQPTTETEPPAGNLAAYQAAIARVALVLREERDHREQTDPSERKDCIMCGADHFAEIRDAIKGKQPTTETEQS